MRKTLIRAGLAGLAVLTLAAAGGPAFAQAAAEAQAGPYTVDATQVGTLLDDPEAAAILQRMIPTVYANEMFKTMGRSQTLKAIQQYEPDALSDENLAKIQAEFDKLNAARK